MSKFPLTVTGDAKYLVMPLRHKVSWVLSNITYTTHIFITLGYWATVYPFREGGN